MSEPTGNPFETPRPAGVPLLQGTLRVIVALQCFGVAAARLHQHRPDVLCEFLGKSRQIPDDQIAHIANIVAYGMIVCGVFSILRPATFVLLPVIVYQAALPVAILMEQSGTAAMLSPAIQAARVMAPLALLIVDFWPPRLKAGLLPCMAAVSFLKLGVVFTFAGWSALFLDQCQHGGPLVEQVQQVMQRVLQRELNAEQAQRVLGVLGALSAGIALSLLSGRNRSIAAFAALFGLVLAASETLAFGKAGYDLTLIRISEAGAPLCVLIFWMKAIREQKGLYVAEPGTKAATPAGPKPAVGKPAKRA